MDQSTWEFNKELIIGEIGAWIGAPLVAFITSQFTKSPTIISFSAVAGVLISASVFWLATRIYHQKRKQAFSIAALAKDIAYFTPVAFSIAMLVYNPLVYFISHKLLTQGYHVIPSVIVSQGIAFALFLLLINFYRVILHHVTGRRL